MSEPLFYRAILTGFFQEQREKSDVSIEEMLQIISSFCGTNPERNQCSCILYGMQNQAIFGYSIKIHHYKAYDSETLKIFGEKTFIEYIGQRTMIPNFPDIAAYQCSEIKAEEVSDSLWNALGYSILKKEEIIDGTLIFKYAKNITIFCNILKPEVLSMEIVISEPSVNDLIETVEKFVNLFEKSFTWRFEESMMQFSSSDQKKQ